MYVTHTNTVSEALNSSPNFLPAWFQMPHRRDNLFVPNFSFNESFGTLDIVMLTSDL